MEIPVIQWWGNVPQNLTDAVTVVFATPRADRGKGGGMKGMRLGTVQSERSGERSIQVLGIWMYLVNQRKAMFNMVKSC